MTEHKQEQIHLNKYLSQLDVWALSLGCIIGWGAFVMPGTTFLPLAGPGGTIIAMVISALVTMVIARNYFTLMKKFPGTGGLYAYAKELFGRDHAFLGSWFLCLSYVSLIPQNATILAYLIRIITGDAFLNTFHYEVAGTNVYLAEVMIAIAALVLIGIFAICMKPFLQSVQTALGIILFAGVLGIAVLVTPHVPWDSLWQFSPEHTSVLRGIVSIVILAPWAFVGFEVVSLETAHFHFPVQKSGRLLSFAILSGTMIYCVLAVTAILRQPAGFDSWQAYVAGIEQMNGVSAVPTFYVLETLFGKGGIVLITIVAAAAVVSSIIGFYRASARMLMNMAEDHILTAEFQKPTVCFIFLMSLSAFISLFGRNALAWIVNLSSLGAIIGFGYTSAAVYSLSVQSKDQKGTIFGMTGVVLAIAFAAAQLIPGISLIETMGAESYLLLSAWCLLGFAFYWRTMAADQKQTPQNESLTVGSLFLLLTFSIVVWYIKKMKGAAGSVLDEKQVVGYSVVLLLFILAGMLITMMIHTQLKKLQMDIEAERIRAIESSQAKSRFLFNMSHDIRTPMNAVIGYVTLALKEPVSPSVRNYLEKIEISSRHMLDLINDILEMSRIESGKMELEEGVTDLREVFEEIVHLFDQQMKEKNIHFSVDISDIKNNVVICDRKNLVRVLLNLITNAYKFTNENGLITVSMKEYEAGSYEIRIKDSGIGMKKEFVEKMFNAFERERTSTDSGIQGTGLGLAITKSIIDLMDGTIDVETELNKGTEMIVRIALKPADAQTQKEVTVENETTETDFTGVRVLLVEDNAINMEIAKMILEQEGFVIETAENGQLAVDKVISKDGAGYDLILMDIQMPVMNGYEAARAIRALPDEKKAKIPIVAMTANAFKEDEMSALQSGMQAHIAKPIDVPVMMKTIAEVMYRK